MNVHHQRRLIDEMIELFSVYGSFTRGKGAEDKNGKLVHYADPTACKWCLSGGLLFGTHELTKEDESGELFIELSDWGRCIIAEAIFGDVKASPDYPITPTSATSVLVLWNDSKGRKRQDLVDLLKQVRRNLE